VITRATVHVRRVKVHEQPSLRAYDERDDEQRVRVVEVHEDVRQVWAFTSNTYFRYRAVDFGIRPTTNRWVTHGVTDGLVRRGRRRQ